VHLCQICQTHPTSSVMCDPCGRSYDRTAFRDGSIIEAMAWAAQRARRFERRKTRREAKAATKRRKKAEPREGGGE
jgi:DNA invertase Pin-like site-specific DNA recombinase